MTAALVTTAEAVRQTLQEGEFSKAFTPRRSYAQWQRPLEIGEAQGLLVDIVPVSRLESDLITRGSVQYAPKTDVVIRRKFAGLDLEEVPGEPDHIRVKQTLVDELVQLVEEIHQALVAKRIGDDGEAAWQEEDILAAYLPSHLRDKHQFTGVIRLTHTVTVELP